MYRLLTVQVAEAWGQACQWPNGQFDWHLQFDWQWHLQWQQQARTELGNIGQDRYASPGSFHNRASKCQLAVICRTHGPTRGPVFDRTLAALSARHCIIFHDFNFVIHLFLKLPIFYVLPFFIANNTIIFKFTTQVKNALLNHQFRIITIFVLEFFLSSKEKQIAKKFTSRQCFHNNT